MVLAKIMKFLYFFFLDKIRQIRVFGAKVATKPEFLVATLATRFLYDLDLE